ncbi:MAG: aminoglycoside phosphotransferase family protein [Desulfobacterales bacterium]|nr:MAG: aminoglycoside phosphotransferase family protein [Desulfobacterales bacterium]
MDSIEILAMTPGSYNLNYHVRVDRKEFIFRINIDPQSGLSNQIEYEFRVLKFLEGHGIAPKAYYFDDSRKRFDFDILIEEYLRGPPLPLEKKYLPAVAQILMRLHSLEPRGVPLVIRRNPLAGIFEQTRNELTAYAAKMSPDKKTIGLGQKVLAKSETLIGKHQQLFQADSLIHTDLCCENFVLTAGGLRLIDWEKPRVDDGIYDVACFLAGPAELYNSDTVLNSEERTYFIEIYARLGGKNPDYLMEKLKIIEPLISMHWILWAATMLCNLRDRHTSPELVEVHKVKIARYERVANPENIEKLLDIL